MVSLRQAGAHHGGTRQRLRLRRAVLWQPDLAAARLANTSGFSAAGKTSGNAAPASVSLGAVEAAGAAAGASQQAAQAQAGTHADTQLPSIVEVEVLSLSNESDEERRRRRGGS